MKKIIIGTKGEGFDLDVLLSTRGLIQANSGQGKSYLLRKLIEQLYGHVQVIVIDPEGEFQSLREKFDFVLVGSEGETPADVRSASMLATKLLELNASAICDIYELRNHERHEWVKLFLNSMLDAPKKLWHPVVIILDEAHMFAPEKGQGDSVAFGAVADMASKGRKRGFCLIPATQRLGKLSKNVTAELQNVLIGGTFQDIDRKRAAETLGISKSDERDFFNDIKMLMPGEFFALGRAISREKILFQVGKVVTTHPQSGMNNKLRTAPPSDKIKALLPQLQDLPAQAEEKKKTEAELRKEISDLKKKISTMHEGKIEVKKIEVSVIDDKMVKRVEEYLGKVLNIIGNGEIIINDLRKEHSVMLTAIKSVTGQSKSKSFYEKGIKDTTERFISRAVKSYPGPVKFPVSRAIDEQSPNGSPLPIGEKITLSALIQFPEGLQRNQLTVLTGYKRSSRDAYLARLNAKGYVENSSGGSVRATTAGIQAIPDAKPLPTGVELQQYWLQKLPEGERKVLEILIDSYPEPVSRLSIDEATGYMRSSRDAYLARMTAKQLVIQERAGFVKASPNLFSTE